MMWAAKPRERVPQVWEKRTVRRFAFWPTRVDEDEDPPVVVWLEWYFVYQEWGSTGYGNGWITLAKYSAVPV